MLSFEVDRDGPVSLEVFDTRGRLVRVLYDDFATRGKHDVVWDGRDARGARNASGVYIARLQTDDGTRSIRMVMAQ